VTVSEKFRNLARIGRRLAGVDEHARVFNRHYMTNAWIGGGSGTGSTPEVTASYRDFLSKFLKENKIKSVVDLGCGDWQFSQLIDWTGIDYLGVDVSGVVLENTKRFTKPGIRFLELNGTSGSLPGGDLLILKDVIQHWSNADVKAFLPNLSKFKYALITNGSHSGSNRTNSDDKVGGCRPVDLIADPFNVRGDYIFEFQADEPKITFLWTRF
jgi:SAM-dependent methyltransferase